ncbi:endoplasmic oxidoreductin [Aulographum hederae CBS 113979]|uniref:Endoplasmic oxidoreductin n=1 Tax=Aulographum hederae CBS 113979 TaxID=1176131 RepID=A0A6G1GZK7_9PEZI|nr:endoplasmic oxidoreductin [Aulographum hederae CBS 113979]
MPSAAKVFYLAVFALLRTSHATGTSSSSSKQPARSKEASPNVCAFEPNAIVSDACASYETLDHINAGLHPYINAITTNTDFFSFYRLNLYNKKCPFWDDEGGMCGNIACAVNTLENEDDVPLVWRAKELGKLEGPKAQHPDRLEQQEREAQRPLKGQLGADVGESCVLEYDDECDERDYCIPEDERSGSKGDYVSLVDNPERFTGYGGAGAHQVWEAIYRENCFAKPQPEKDNEELSTGMSSSPFGFSNLQQAQAAQDLRNVIKEHGVQQGLEKAIAKGDSSWPFDENLEFEDSCVEKRVFYRVISGMHASISTHLCNEFLNQTTGEWGPNVDCYAQRLHHHPERISNLYFNYALLLRAAGKLRAHMSNYQFCSADPQQDLLTKGLVLSLANAIPAGPEIFDESTMFVGPEAVGLKEDFRNRFRNVSRVMDCVGCDKCRLWGKLQTAGYGTALKILFEFDENDSSNDPPLRRTELVALVNTLDRVSTSLNSIREFRKMLEAREAREAQPPVSLVDPKATSSRPEEGSKETSSAPKVAVVETEDDGYPDFTRKYDRNMTITEEFWQEFGLIWRIMKYILRSWIEMPGKFLRIFLMEMGRLWDYWLGIPVQPRSWEFKFPKKEEL